jgi:cysteine desulfurase
MHRIYLDHNATTAAHPQVVQALLPFYEEEFGNPSSGHWAGRNVRQAVEEARTRVASLLRCTSSEVFFTSGGSESLNTALKGVATARRNRGRHIVTTRVEHAAVFNTCRYLEREGFRVTYLDVDGDGLLDPGEVAAALTDETILVAAMYANNETGVLFPVAEVGSLAAARGIPFLCDAVQAAGKIPLDLSVFPVDLLALSAHKLYGPKGVGALVVRNEVRLRPLVHGGGQERDRRSGTENVPAIVGFGRACQLAGETLATEPARQRALRDRLEDGLLNKLVGVTRNGHAGRRLPNTANLSFAGISAARLLEELDRLWVAASAGSACSSNSRATSRVLAAMGRDAAAVQGAVRFSLGRTTTKADIDYVLEVVPPLVDGLRRG